MISSEDESSQLNINKKKESYFKFRTIAGYKREISDLFVGSYDLLILSRNSYQNVLKKLNIYKIENKTSHGLIITGSTNYCHILLLYLASQKISISNPFINSLLCLLHISMCQQIKGELNTRYLNLQIFESIQKLIQCGFLDKLKRTLRMTFRRLSTFYIDEPKGQEFRLLIITLHLTCILLSSFIIGGLNPSYISRLSHSVSRMTRYELKHENNESETILESVYNFISTSPYIISPSFPTIPLLNLARLLTAAYFDSLQPQNYSKYFRRSLLQSEQGATVKKMQHIVNDFQKIDFIPDETMLKKRFQESSPNGFDRVPFSLRNPIPRVDCKIGKIELMKILQLMHEQIHPQGCKLCPQIPDEIYDALHDFHPEQYLNPSSQEFEHFMSLKQNLSESYSELQKKNFRTFAKFPMLFSNKYSTIDKFTEEFYARILPNLENFLARLLEVAKKYMVIRKKPRTDEEIIGAKSKELLYKNSVMIILMLMESFKSTHVYMHENYLECLREKGAIKILTSYFYKNNLLHSSMLNTDIGPTFPWVIDCPDYPCVSDPQDSKTITCNIRDMAESSVQLARFIGVVATLRVLLRLCKRNIECKLKVNNAIKMKDIPSFDELKSKYLHRHLDKLHLILLQAQCCENETDNLGPSYIVSDYFVRRWHNEHRVRTFLSQLLKGKIQLLCSQDTPKLSANMAEYHYILEKNQFFDNPLHPRFYYPKNIEAFHEALGINPEIYDIFTH